MGQLIAKLYREPEAPPEGALVIEEDTTKVTLASRNLREFPEDLLRLQRLEYLTLSYNKLVKLDPRIRELGGSLTRLVLVGNRLRTLPDEVGDLQHLVELNVSKNALTALPSTIGELGALETLNAMLNRIEVLPNAVGKLAALKRLRLSVNQLHQLPATIGQVRTLCELDVSSNHLTDLPDCFSELTALETLNVRNNLIDALPKSVCACSALRTLDARNNEIAKLPKRIGMLGRLRTLHLTQNQLESLPSSLGDLGALCVLSLAQNQLGALPAAVFGIATLVELDAHQNQIAELPADDDAFRRLQALATLDLRSNWLQELPAGIGALAALRTLLLNDNYIAELPAAVGRLAALGELELANNQLTALPAELARCRQLSVLDVTRNKVTAVPKQLGALGLLVQLKLGGNAIGELPAPLFDGTVNLLDLNVFGNQLKSLPETLGNCTRLQHLNCGYNKLTSLPASIAKLSALQTAFLSGNRFTALPAELWALPLRELFVSGNRLESLPAALERLAETLTVFDASANRLSEVAPSVCKLDKLKELELGHNRITRLPSQLAALRQLINLDLSHNVGLQLSAALLGELRSVTQLKVAYCEMGKFPADAALPPELALLALEGNLLAYDALPANVQGLTEMSRFSSTDRKHFEVSWSEMRGRRPSQEDTIVIHTNAAANLDWRSLKSSRKRIKRDMGIVAVFDGHRGSSAAEYAATHLTDTLYKACAEDSVENALKTTFNALSQQIIDKKYESGTTALVTVFVGNDLFVANCGDARAVLCREGNAVRLSVDHKPDDPLERKRIRELGGYVSYTGRILDDIMVARSLGDAQNQPYVTSEPYVAHFQLSEKDLFLILGCDGIWDVISDEEAVELVRDFSKESVAAPAVALRDIAYSAGSTDNLSVIIIFLKDPATIGGSSGAGDPDVAAATTTTTTTDNNKSSRSKKSKSSKKGKSKD